MNILHTVTCTRYSAHYKAHVEFQRSLTRNRRLTRSGIERILRRDDNDPETGEPRQHPIVVCRVETAIYSR
jgi:hypothetical protein